MISEVHNIDCIEYMRTLPDKAFDLAIADPPYGGAGNEQFEGGGRFGQRFSHECLGLFEGKNGKTYKQTQLFESYAKDNV